MNPLASDLDHILAYTRGLWDELRGQRIFITGGTGFFGCWLLESFLWVNDRLRLGASVAVLTRHPESFRSRLPHLGNHPDVKFCQGNVLDFEFPHEDFSYFMHAATEADPKVMETDPLRAFDINLEGTRRVLEFARQAHVRRFLFTSSGAVYGRQPVELALIPETYFGGPDPADTLSTYGVPGEAKRAAETLCALYTKQHGVPTTIARCFSFLGPYLPLEGKFAIGNFIRDGLRGGPIRISGDGTPWRSYLYAADLAIWLWNLLFRGQSGRAYNVGSENPISMRSLAEAVALGFPSPIAVETARQPVLGQPGERYVPSTHKARNELGLRETVDLREGIKRTISWHQRNLSN